MGLLKPFLIGFVLSSLLLSPFSVVATRPVRPAEAPTSQISIIPCAAPSSEPDSGNLGLELDVSSSNSLKGLDLHSSKWKALDLASLKQTAKSLPQLPKLDMSSLHVDPTVLGVCSGTDYPKECILSIIPFLHEKPRVKPVDILQMEMHALFDKANATLELAKDLMLDPSTPRPVANILDTCVDNYESLLDDLLDAATAVDDHDLGRLESLLSATISDVATCSDAFAERPELESPMAVVDEFLKKLCSNVLAISQTLDM